MRVSRLVTGLGLIAGAILLFVFGDGSYQSAYATVLLVLGLVVLAISRRK